MYKYSCSLTGSSFSRCVFGLLADSLVKPFRLYAGRVEVMTAVVDVIAFGCESVKKWMGWPGGAFVGVDRKSYTRDFFYETSFPSVPL